MSEKPVKGEKRVFMTGNEVCAWAALAAGADIMYGYPITPQNEIMHYWTHLSPKFGKKFLQTEDERVLRAAEKIISEDLAKLILIGNETEIIENTKKLKYV